MSKKTIISIIENLLMVLLLFAMLVQCVWYINLARNGGEGALPDFPESEASFLANDSLALSETGKSHLTPYFVGVILEDGMYGGTYEDSIAYEIFGNFAKVLENAPGGTAKKVVYPGTEKKYEYLDSLYNDTKNCYYVRFRNGLEFSALCQLMSDTDTDIPQSPEFEVRDMFLICGSSGEASITAVDDEGSVLKIYPSKNIPFNNEYLETYNNTEKDEFEFVEVDVNTTADKNCYFPAFRYSVDYRTVRRIPFSEYFSFNEFDADVRDFVSIFGMNSDNTKFYKRSSDGAIICVENATTFEISSDGSILFVPEVNDGGLDLYLDTSLDSDYGFYEYSRAAQNIVSLLNDKLYGCAGVLSLADIAYNEGECSFYYSFTVNGVPVEQNGGCGLELVFSGDRLRGARGRIAVCIPNGDSVTDIPQKTAWVLMEKHGTVKYFGPEYTFPENSVGNDLSVMRWKVEYASAYGGDRE
ncbi:MAG: hypothetical protein E7583_05790 [Ruminococcaceae bacterium]|nr:hypothetical protein [Oscillospiraceae bacterium]